MTDQLLRSTSRPPALPATQLPLASSSSLLLVPATPLEYVHTWHLNADEWRGPLTLEQYFDREEWLKNQALTKNDQITAWILTSETLPQTPDGARPILAACETLLKHAFVAKNGQVSQIRSHGVASVYTRQEYRSRGYARRMMEEVGKALKTWQQDDGATGLFSTLYSDIGTLFYATSGWKVFPSTHILLTCLESEEAYDAIRQDLGLPLVSDMQAEDLQQLPTVQHLEEELKRGSTNDPSLSFVAYRPDLNHFGWHHAREDVQCRILQMPEPKVKGAVHAASGVGLIWCRVFASKPEHHQLAILRTVVPPQAITSASTDVELILAALLLRAQLEARKWKMLAGVELWSPADVTLKAAQRLRREEEGQIEVMTRDKEHVCCLKWDGNANEQVVWLANERYAWC